MSTQENPPGSGRSRGREIALNVGAIAGLICVVVAGVSFLFGIKPLVFRSGSMSPEIPTGALALSKSTPASNLHVGDVVSVQTESGTRITHRIHEVLSSDGTTSALVLKGDANQDADVMPYTVTEADRVFFSVPGLGYAVSWLSTPIATFLGGALVGGVMVIAFGRRSAHKDDDHTDGESRRGEASSVEEAHEPARPIERVQSAAGAETDSARYSSRSWMSRKGVVAAGALSLAALMGTSVGTSAAFTDTALVSGSSFASFSTFTPAPLYVGCSRAAGAEAWGADRIDFKWKHLGPGYTYDIQLINDRGTSTTLTSPSLPANKGDIITKSWTSPDLKGYTATGLDKYVYVEVRSRRSFANGTVQTGPAWTGEKINAYSQVDSYCSGKHETGPISPSSAGGELPAARMAQQTEALTT
ncbi:signal peptidase I, partial [Prescottella equi]